MSTPTGFILYEVITSDYLFPLHLPVKKVQQSVEHQFLDIILPARSLCDSTLKKIARNSWFCLLIAIFKKFNEGVTYYCWPYLRSNKINKVSEHIK